VITIKLTHQHGAIAEPVAGADEFQNLTRGESGLGFRVCTGGQLKCGLWIADCGLRILNRQRPIFFQRGQR
jgi:hypothetical protein